jgi:hypothetical protein
MSGCSYNLNIFNTWMSDTEILLPKTCSGLKIRTSFIRASRTPFLPVPFHYLVMQPWSFSDLLRFCATSLFAPPTFLGLDLPQQHRVDIYNLSVAAFSCYTQCVLMHDWKYQKNSFSCVAVWCAFVRQFVAQCRNVHLILIQIKLIRLDKARLDLEKKKYSLWWLLAICLFTSLYNDQIQTWMNRNGVICFNSQLTFQSLLPV